MLENTLFHHHRFWQFLEFLEKSKPKRISLEELQYRFQFIGDESVHIVSLLQKLHYKVHIDKDILGRSGLSFLGFPPTVKIEFSFREWLALQAHLIGKQLNNVKEDFVEESHLKDILTHKIQKHLELKDQHNLFRLIQIQKERQKFFSMVNSNEYEIVEKVDEAIIGSAIIRLKFYRHKPLTVFPHRLVVVDTELSVVGEDCAEQSLVQFELREIEKVDSVELSSYRPQFYSNDVNEFISALREVMGTEERLVLKVLSQDQLDLNPHFQFFGNPFVTSNSHGEIIWAANIERSEHLYSWLYEIKEHIEILDPIGLKEDFFEFCQTKSNKLKIA